MLRVGGLGPHLLVSKQGRGRAIPSTEQTAQSCWDPIVFRWLSFLFCAGLCSWEEMNLPSGTIQISLKAVAAVSLGHTAPFGR